MVAVVNTLLGTSNDYSTVGAYTLDNKRNGPRREYCLGIFTNDSGGVRNCTGWLMLNEMRAHLDGMHRGLFAARDAFGKSVADTGVFKV